MLLGLGVNAAKKRPNKHLQLRYYSCRAPVNNVDVNNIGLAGFTQCVVVRTVKTREFFLDIAEFCFKIKSALFYIGIELKNMGRVLQIAAMFLLSF